MPAEVMIQTAERTFVQYLTKPITDSMSRAFREQ
jgi:HlyD family secretion protein